MKMVSEILAIKFTLTSVSEDCLYLNVYTPSQRLASEKLPVSTVVNSYYGKYTYSFSTFIISMCFISDQ